MGAILDDGEDPDDGRGGVAEGEPRACSTTWLAGVTTRDGGDGLAAVPRRRSASERRRGGRAMEWITAHKIPVGEWAGDGVDWLTAHAAWFFDGLAAVVNALIAAILWALQTPHAAGHRRDLRGARLVPAALLVDGGARGRWASSSSSTRATGRRRPRR